MSAAYLYRAPASTIDIVQPPGIGIPPIADMDAHQTIVAAALAAKSSAETPKKARWEARSETTIEIPYSIAAAFRHQFCR